jgi:hypothetical protein
MKTFIGIDPGVATGLAIWIPETKHYELYTLSFFEAYSRILTWHIALDDELQIIIENPNKNRPTFERGALVTAKRNKISQNVGENKRDAKLWIEMCRFYGIKYTDVRPTRTKLTAEGFEKFFGIKTKCSQHARDAFRLIGGR